MVIRDVRTRWNYTHAMIKRALILQKVAVLIHGLASSWQGTLQAIHKWVVSHELQDLVLQPDQWVFLEKLGSILEVRNFTVLRHRLLTWGSESLGFYACNIPNVTLQHTDSSLGSSNVCVHGETFEKPYRRSNLIAIAARGSHCRITETKPILYQSTQLPV